jgi:hypothetical protein
VPPRDGSERAAGGLQGLRALPSFLSTNGGATHPRGKIVIMGSGAALAPFTSSIVNVTIIVPLAW